MFFIFRIFHAIHRGRYIARMTPVVCRRTFDYFFRKMIKIKGLRWESTPAEGVKCITNEGRYKLTGKGTSRGASVS
jgi:hypothetical protein